MPEDAPEAFLGAVEAQKRKPRVFADRPERAYGCAAGRDLGA